MNRRISLFALALFAVLAFAVVQAQARAHGKDAKGKQVSMTGCLNSTGSNQYQLTANGKTYDLRPEADVNLADHVGHKVKVTGMEVKEEGSQAGAQPGNEPGTETGGTPSGTAGWEIHVKQIQHISNTCP